MSKFERNLKGVFPERGSLDWPHCIQNAQHRAQGRSFVNTAMILRFQWEWVISSPAKQLHIYRQKRICSCKLVEILPWSPGLIPTNLFFRRCMTEIQQKQNFRNALSITLMISGNSMRQEGQVVPERLNVSLSKCHLEHFRYSNASIVLMKSKHVTSTCTWLLLHSITYSIILRHLR